MVLMGGSKREGMWELVWDGNKGRKLELLQLAYPRPICRANVVVNARRDEAIKLQMEQ